MAIATPALLSRIALGVVTLIGAGETRADGERTPMIGIAAVGASAPEPGLELLGFAVESAWWWGAFGLAAEGSMRWTLEAEGPRASVLGASARVRLSDSLWPALLEPRDVELGVELQGVVERTWWRGRPDGDPIAYGVGVALRLRGSGDHDESILLAESRLFVRAMLSSRADLDRIARTTLAPEASAPRERCIVIGLGASFGAGEPGYLARFRARRLMVARIQ
jgi:hypothetical protein